MHGDRHWGSNHSGQRTDIWANIFTGTIPRELSPSKLRLKTYAGEKISVQGETVAPVTIQGVEYQLPIVVVAGATRPLRYQDNIK